MRGKFPARKSRKQFQHPMPPATALVAAPRIPRSRRARVTPPPPLLLKGHVRRGPVRGLGQTARPVIPGSRRIHQPAPSPQLYRGGTRHGWINQQTQPRPVARPHRSNWPHGICLESGRVAAILSHPGKKGNNNGGGGNKPPPKPHPQTAAPLIPGSRRVHSPLPVHVLHGHVRRGRVPAVVIPFLLLAGRRVANPQARPQPQKGDWQRRRAPNMPPLTGLEAIPVVAAHRFVHSQVPWQQARSAVWRGRVPGPTAPFLLREGRRCQGARPRPASGHVSRASLPPPGLVAGFRVRKSRLYRVFLPPGVVLGGQVRRGLLFFTGQAAQTVLFACDVLPLRVGEDQECALRPEVSSDPGQRPEVEDSCPARPSRCPDET